MLIKVTKKKTLATKKKKKLALWLRLRFVNQPIGIPNLAIRILNIIPNSFKTLKS